MRVLVVSFGRLEGAKIWLEQTGCTFDIVLDPQRKVGVCFGFFLGGGGLLTDRQFM